MITRAYLSSSELYSVGRLVVRSPHSCGVRLRLIGRAAGIDEHADHDRNLAPVDQVVHHVLRAHIAVLVHERLAVLVDHQAGRHGRIVLRGHVDPVSVLGAGIGLARQCEGPADLALGNAFLRHGIRTQPVLGIGIGARGHGFLNPRARLLGCSRLLPRGLARTRLRPGSLRVGQRGRSGDGARKDNGAGNRKRDIWRSRFFRPHDSPLRTKLGYRAAGPRLYHRERNRPIDGHGSSSVSSDCCSWNLGGVSRPARFPFRYTFYDNPLPDLTEVKT